MFVLDTDHATLYQQGYPALGERLKYVPPSQLATTIVTYEEQVAGRLAVVRRAQKVIDRVHAFFWLQQTLNFFCRMPILPFDEAATQAFQQLVPLKLRIGTQDLLIAAIVLAQDATLLTRNLRGFQRVPHLSVEDWSV
jgi:tRNA(fMet)-specific endonuclease VapC